MSAAGRSADVGWIEVEERDLDFPLDHDGTPTSAGRTWLVPIASIAAVEVEPENTRGIIVKIHVRGQRAPIVPCDPEDALAALGARVGAVCGGHLIWAGPDDDDELGEEAVGATGCPHCGEPLGAIETLTWCGPAGEERWLHQRCEAPALAEQQRQLEAWLARWQQQLAEEEAAP